MKTNLPRVSVIVPCFNQAEFLADALESVCAQTYRNWECIIVNDGSSDSTEKVALSWSQRDGRYRYIKKDNGGLADARNCGIKDSSGDIILPLDADDRIGTEYLEKAVDAFLEDPHLCIVYCRSQFFGVRNEPWDLPEFQYSMHLSQPQIFCSALFLKEDWNFVGGYDLNMRHGWEDWEFWINLLRNTRKSVRKLDYLGFYYRRHERSMMTKLENSKDFLRKRKESREYIYKKHSAEYHSMFGSYMDLLRENKKLKRTVRDWERIKQSIGYRVWKKLANGLTHMLSIVK